MKHKLTYFTLILAFCFSTSLQAQRNPNLQQANKEFDLHAYNLAIKSYRKVLNKDPDNAIAYAGIGDCYRLIGRMAESADWYKKALQLPDVDPSVLFNYGKVLMSLGEYERAAEWFLVYAEGQPLYGNHYAESSEFAISLRGMPGIYRVKKEFINTDASDFGPAFFKGNVVYSSARTDLVRQMEKDRNNWDGAAKNQLFISSLDDKGYLAKPTFLQSDLQNAYNQGLISYSHDGKWLAFAKNNFVNGTRQIPAAGMDGSIFIAAAKENGSWDDAIAFPHNGSGYSSVYPHLSADGQKLYFSSNRPDGFGGFDIYVSYRIGSTWTSPENLGPVINSPGNEISPYMDNGILYFSSDWHHGLGGMDIFRAVTEDGLWSKVYHLGNAVNSPADDYSLIIDSKANKGYFVSNRKGGVGNEDIYSISKMSEDATISVVDKETGKALPGANLDFTACGSKVFPTDESGKYRFQVFDGLLCDVIVSLEGYKIAVLKIDEANSTSNAYTVAMEIAPNLISGLLFNSRDNRPVGDVVVTAQAKGSDQKIRTISSSNGSYQLDLQENTDYIIRYSKVGYLDIHQKISTTDNIEKDILGVLMLNASTTSLEEKPEIVIAGPPKNNNGKTTTTGSPAGEKEGTTSKTDMEPDNGDVASGNDSEIPVDIFNPNPGNGSASTPTETSPDDSNNTTTKPEPQRGFSVQVAALGLKDKVVNDKYIALSGIGNLYSRPDKGMKKVRVGIYRTKSEAAEARENIVAKGFTSAFIVTEVVVDEKEIEVFDAALTLEPATPPKKETTNTKTVADKKSNSEITTSNTASSGSSIFMVRLATYGKPEFFDDSEVKKIGKVEQRLKGDMTIMLLTGFPTLQAARNASKQAVKKGFKGAHVVLEENGKLIKI